MQKRQVAVTISMTVLAALQFALMAFPAPLGAETAGRPPAPGARTCVSAQCHAGMGKDKSVHKPVQEGSCVSCHQVSEDPSKKSKHPDHLIITLVQQGADLCARCHEPKNRKTSVHAPVKQGDCGACHASHQSAHKGLLKDDERNLCFRCHPGSMVKQSVMHPPVAGGSCSACHDHHQSDVPRLLTQGGNALCFRCHTKLQETFRTGKFAHDPARQSCVKCHDPHGSAAADLLKAAVPEICSPCHPKQVALRDRAITKHGPVMEQKSCLNCHDPHVADQARLLRTGERALCLACHNREMVTAGGKMKDLKAFLDANNGGQGPLKGKPCVSCHNPHGAAYWRLLEKNYTSAFYVSFSDAPYSLCFSCHKREAFTTVKTAKGSATLTGFRDGSRNLHYVHVNKIEKGRTCRACHDVCAECQSSGAPKHMKKTVMFSGWMMPLNFIPSANGGSCAPGCHGEKMYQR